MMGWRVYKALASTHSGNSQASSGSYSPYHLVQDDVDLLRLSICCNSLVTNSIYSSVHLFASSQLEDRIHCIALTEVDGDPVELLAQGQSLRHSIDDIDVCRSHQTGRVCRHQAHGTGTPYCNGLAGLETGEDTAMVASGEDVGEHHEVGFVLGSGRQDQGVEVGKGDTNPLGLATVVLEGMRKEASKRVGGHDSASGTCLKSLVRVCRTHRTHGNVSIRSSGKAFVDIGAERCKGRVKEPSMLRLHLALPQVSRCSPVLLVWQFKQEPQATLKGI
jgi:hypothetical protein